MFIIKEALNFNRHKERVFIHSYCVMDNHYHQLTSYKESSSFLSNYMRYAHTLFGARYNRLHKRSGKVAESRPKTSLIENTEHEIRVHFYIEANPIRAKMRTPENLRSYKFNSFKFYAYGLEDEHTKILTVPQWYKELGKTPSERQRKYRKLFYEYLSEQIILNPLCFEKNFIGSAQWMLTQKERVLDLIKPHNSS